MKINILFLVLWIILLPSCVTSTKMKDFILDDISGKCELNYNSGYLFDCDSVNLGKYKDEYGRTCFNFNKNGSCDYILWGTEFKNRPLKLKNDTIRITETNPEVCTKM